MGSHSTDSSKPSQPSSTIHSINTVRLAQAESLPLDEEEVCLHMQNHLGSTPVPTLLSIKDSIIKNPSLHSMVRDFLKSEISANNLLNALMEKFVELKEFMKIEDAASLTSEFIFTREKLLGKITRKIYEIKRKLRKSKKLKKITKIVVKVAIVTVSVVPIVLVAMSMPAAVTTSIAMGSNLIKKGGKWLDSAWASHLEGLKGERDVLLAMRNGLLEVRITQELDIICEMVNQLKILRNGLINTSRLADTEEIISQMKVRVEACNGEIRKTASDFLKIIVE